MVIKIPKKIVQDLNLNSAHEERLNNCMRHDKYATNLVLTLKDTELRELALKSHLKKLIKR